MRFLSITILIALLSASIISPQAALSEENEQAKSADFPFQLVKKISNSASPESSPNEAPSGSPVYDLALSSDGKRLASAHFHRLVVVWDTADCSEVLRIEDFPTACYPIRCVDFSPDGKELAIAANRGLIEVRSVQTGKLIWKVQEADEEEEALPTALSFSPSGKYLMAIDPYGRYFKVWNRKKEKIHWKHDFSRQSIGWDGKFGPDENELLTIGRHLTKWNLDQKTSRHLFQFALGGAIKIFPDGKKAAIAQVGGIIGIFDLSTNEFTGRLRGHKGVIHSIDFSNDGSFLFSVGKDKELIAWKVDQQKILSRESLEDAVSSVIFLSSKEMVITGDLGGGIQFWKISDL